MKFKELVLQWVIDERGQDFTSLESAILNGLFDPAKCDDLDILALFDLDCDSLDAEAERLGGVKHGFSILCPDKW